MTTKTAAAATTSVTRKRMRRRMTDIAFRSGSQGDDGAGYDQVEGEFEEGRVPDVGQDAKPAEQKADWNEDDDGQQAIEHDRGEQNAVELRFREHSGLLAEGRFKGQE